MGPVGPAGENASASQQYVGSESCGSCHEDQYATFVLSGHPYQLTKIENGEPPVFPYDEITDGIPSPPDGYEWADVSYVVGGYGWKAQFLDLDGYIIAGDEETATQYNLANEDLELPAGWVPYHSGEQLSYDCGTCHTTGYQPEGHQDALEGIVGVWAYPGVQCEACHGPGSLHAADPYGVRMVLDRSSQMCGDCHMRDNPALIDAGDGLEQNYQQYDDLYNSRHFAISCVTCHDPHAGVRFTDPEATSAQGIRQSCENCHWAQVIQKNERRHFNLTCTTCHMPAMAVSAQSIAEEFSGDIHSHQFAINTDPNAPQFSEDGSQVMPYITLQYACQQCHNGSFFSEQDLVTLSEMARDYHEPATATPTPEPTSTVESGEETPTPTPTP